MVFAGVDSKESNLSPLTNFNINFTDRQVLKLLEDSIIDLQVILPALLETTLCIREHCQTLCGQECAKEYESCDCEEILQLFNGHVNELELLCSRARVLKDKAKSTAQLVSCFVHKAFLERQ